MPSRIEIELTSQQDDTWTWRAAGARQPKGSLDGSILPEGASVGDVLRADADFTIDGIDILSVTVQTRQRKEPETIELLGSGSEAPLVTTSVTRDERADSRGEGRGRDRDRKKGRGKGGPRGRPDGERRGGKRGDSAFGDAARGAGRSRPDRPEVPPPPTRPKPPRLKARRAHRKATLEELPPEQRPIAEQVLQGGIPAVRKAVDKQNEQLKAEGKPEISADALIGLAETMLPKLRTAEWRDRAEAALEQLDEVDLRDLRSVVTAADGGARDDETRALAARLRDGLNERLEQEHAHWIADLTDAVEHSRTVRGLHLSSRPPRAGTPVPPELAAGLVKVTNESLTADVSSDRWIRILDALAYSPIRRLVVPASLPTKPSKDLQQAVARLGSRLPEMAHIFGIEPETTNQRRKRRSEEKAARKSGKKKSGDKSEPKPDAAQ